MHMLTSNLVVKERTTIYWQAYKAFKFVILDQFRFIGPVSNIIVFFLLKDKLAPLNS